MPWGRSVSSVIPQLKLQAVGDHGGELLRLRADGADLLPAVGQNTILHILSSFRGIRSRRYSLRALYHIARPEQARPGIGRPDNRLYPLIYMLYITVLRHAGVAKSARPWYHRLTRADTVLTGRNAPILRQTPWQYGKYYLRAFSCLDTFPLRQNCCAPASDVFSSDFWFLRCRRAESAYSRRCCRATFLWSEAGARQDEKDKKRRKDTLSGVFALVNRWLPDIPVRPHAPVSGY